MSPSILTSKGGGTSVRNMMAGDTLFAEVAFPAALSAIKEGFPIKIISGGTDGPSAFWVTRPGEKIDTPEDLKGKRFVYSRPKSVSESTILAVLKSHGIKPSEVTMVAIGDFGAGLTALEHNKIDIAIIPEPIYSQKMKAGAKYQIIPWLDAKLPLYTQTVGIATDDMIAKKGDKLRAVIEGRRKGVDFLYANQKEAAASLAKGYNLPPDIAASAAGRAPEADADLVRPRRAQDEADGPHGAVADRDRRARRARRLEGGGRRPLHPEGPAVQDAMTAAALPELSRASPTSRASTRRARATRRCTRWGRCRSSCAPASSSASSARRAAASPPCSTCWPGLAVPSQGTVEFEGKPVAGDRAGRRRRGVPGGRVLSLAHRRGQCRLRPAPARRGRRRDRAGGSTSRSASWGCSDFRRAYPSQLSGGMRQRVCIARTLVLQPRLILLDEPFGALDQQTRLLMGDELLRLWRETSATVLLITHALDEANLLSDRIGVMSARPGRFIDVVETGWPRDRDSRLAERPDFGAVTSRLWSLLRTESMLAMGQGRAAAR